MFLSQQAWDLYIFFFLIAHKKANKVGRTESGAEESTKPHTQTKTDREIIVFSAPTKVTTEA